jgi:hypothetical protein
MEGHTKSSSGVWIKNPEYYTPKEIENIQSRMDEITFFYESQQRKPQENGRSVIERLLAFRLKEIRNRPNAIAVLRDPHNLLFP